jgi:hypothetical protein
MATYARPEMICSRRLSFCESQYPDSWTEFESLLVLDVATTVHGAECALNADTTADVAVSYSTAGCAAPLVTNPQRTRRYLTATVATPAG